MATSTVKYRPSIRRRTVKRAPPADLDRHSPRRRLRRPARGRRDSGSSAPRGSFRGSASPDRVSPKLDQDEAGASSDGAWRRRGSGSDAVRHGAPPHRGCTQAGQISRARRRGHCTAPRRRSVDGADRKAARVHLGGGRTSARRRPPSRVARRRPPSPPPPSFFASRAAVAGPRRLPVPLPFAASATPASSHQWPSAPAPGSPWEGAAGRRGYRTRALRTRRVAGAAVPAALARASGRSTGREHAQRDGPSSPSFHNGDGSIPRAAGTRRPRDSHVCPLHPCLLHRGRHSKRWRTGGDRDRASAGDSPLSSLLPPPSAVQAHHHPLRPPFLQQARQCREELPRRRGEKPAAPSKVAPRPPLSSATAHTRPSSSSVSRSGLPLPKELKWVSKALINTSVKTCDTSVELTLASTTASSVHSFCLLGVSPSVSSHTSIRSPPQMGRHLFLRPRRTYEKMEPSA